MPPPDESRSTAPVDDVTVTLPPELCARMLPVVSETVMEPPELLVSTGPVTPRTLPSRPSSPPGRHLAGTVIRTRRAEAGYHGRTRPGHPVRESWRNLGADSPYSRW